MKTCTVCKIEKPKTEFSKKSRSKDGLTTGCKACAREYLAANAEVRKEKRRKYCAENVEAIKEKKSKYNAENAERLNAKSREYYTANADTLKEKKREYRAANAETIKEKEREYRANSPEKILAHARNRRARKRAAEGTHTTADVKAIFESQRGICASCTKKLIKSGKNRYHVDHIQPLSKGGSNDKYNLQCLCRGCNIRKNAKDPYDWAKENGKLL